MTLTTKAEILAALGTEDAASRTYQVVMEGNPYVELSNYATDSIQVAKIDSEFYATTIGTIDSGVATEIV